MRWAEYLSNFDFMIHYRPSCLDAKPDALTRRPDVYPKKSFQPLVNSLNNRVAIHPEQLRAALILNEDALVARIWKAPANEYFEAKAKDAWDDPNGTFTLSSDEQLLLHKGRIYIPDYDNLWYNILRAHHNHKL